MKIQPIDSDVCLIQTSSEDFECYEKTVTVVLPKSRFRRLFDLSNFLRGSDGLGENEIKPTSFCLDEMVESFLEESNNNNNNNNNGKQSKSEDESFDSFGCFGNSVVNSHDSAMDACSSLLKSLVICESVCERDLLADCAKIVEKNRICKRKVEINRKVIADCLSATGYDVSICKSRWEKARTYPAGEYEYIDAIIEGDRYIIDIDFRSEFEIARSTKTYKSVLQTLPNIFVGKTDRLMKIINVVSDAAKLSMKKKGMPFPPWRRADYVKAKWLSPCIRINEFDIDVNTKSDTRFDGSKDLNVKKWDPLEMKPKTLKIGGKVIGGLASVIEGNGDNY